MDYEASTAHASERLRFQQETAVAAIKSLTLVNGGAILALLTFIGNSPAKYNVGDLEKAFGASRSVSDSPWQATWGHIIHKLGSRTRIFRMPGIISMI